MTETLLDARTVNVILKALNVPVRNATETCAIVRVLARDAGLEQSTDPDLTGGDFSPFMDRGALMKRALQALSDLEDWCHQNEANWTGYGEMTVPDGAERWTAQAKFAQELVRDNVDPGPIPELLKYEASPIASDGDGYLLEAALQAGAQSINDDATVYAFTQEQLLRFTKCALDRDFLPLWDKPGEGGA
ncbi:hypothetical protein SAMN05428983_0850 [Agrobacterium fabrum]|uniref:Uncharacterized protein n=1 Tax=Agrobacterium fabrum TaxID=1176649 RepID=A0A7Z7BHI4_9HYPH|nr:hypothetical protein [Agrobacterium fabrum]SDJ25647.1 hypothetical protein SAMN05428983_0850 [Agrobacterium fabrum]